jgi:hypothetical protein
MREAVTGVIWVESPRDVEDSWELKSPAEKEAAGEAVAKSLWAERPGTMRGDWDSRIETFGRPLYGMMLPGDMAAQPCHDIATLEWSRLSGSAKRLNFAIEGGFVLPKQLSNCKELGLLLEWSKGSDSLLLSTSSLSGVPSSLVCFRVMSLTLTVAG